MALEKLQITGYKDSKYEGEIAGDYTVLINPESFKEDIEINYADQQATGSAAPELRYEATGRETVSFKLIFDGTGLVATAPKSLKKDGKIKNVSLQIKEFKQVTSEYSGSIHRPYFLELVWGKFIFQGVLTSLSITYKLFNAKGLPLRAEADVSFSSSVPPAKQNRLQADNSPDVTHIKKILVNDRLPALCNNVYDDPNYFVQVATFNNLNQVRRLKVGSELSFPPIENSNTTSNGSKK